ncbi:hypothetical protein F7725_008008 [Dissostichus mawsoni]|uniref:Uncharacterized protein n=1 Tax=Dissostichus mawsoni TaxID=36200 RepID=A0A7J5Y5Y8_DISMA|nr:hypothetical protein F7725_008008 [Dissostichus mawsoni]
MVLDLNCQLSGGSEHQSKQRLPPTGCSFFFFFNGVFKTKRCIFNYLNTPNPIIAICFFNVLLFVFAVVFICVTLILLCDAFTLFSLSLHVILLVFFYCRLFYIWPLFFPFLLTCSYILLCHFLRGSITLPINSRQFVSSWYMKKKNGLFIVKVRGKEYGIMPEVVAAAAVLFDPTEKPLSSDPIINHSVVDAFVWEKNKHGNTFQVRQLQHSGTERSIFHCIELIL